MVTQAGTCWVVTDHAAGNQRQALALAAALGLAPRHLLLEARAPWSWLAPHLAAGSRYALPPAQRAAFAPPWPRLAIGCGRQAALWTRRLRALSGGSCYTVQILDPRMAPDHWDTVIAPRHDGLAGPNVIDPLGSLNPVDDAWLAEARARWPQLGQLPSPRVGVLLGGPRRGIDLDADCADALARRLRDHCQAQAGSLLVVASRRTPDAVAEAFRRHVRAAVPGLFWRNDDDGPNPYAGVLAWSDALVVTPDSVNMLSEACAVGCPVHTFASAPLPARIARFHQALRQRGLLHDLGESVPVQAPPLRETAAVAALVRARMDARTRSA